MVYLQSRRFNERARLLLANLTDAVMHTGAWLQQIINVHAQDLDQIESSELQARLVQIQGWLVAITDQFAVEAEPIAESEDSTATRRRPPNSAADSGSDGKNNHG